jgi:hypothetical protein
MRLRPLAEGTSSFDKLILRDGAGLAPPQDEAAPARLANFLLDIVA